MQLLAVGVASGLYSSGRSSKMSGWQLTIQRHRSALPSIGLPCLQSKPDFAAVVPDLPDLTTPGLTAHLDRAGLYTFTLHLQP